jgi:membrane protein YdbS with pleckstrin-like domain
VRSSKASAVANEQLVAEVRRHELGLVGIAVRLAVVVGLAGALWAVIEVWLPPKTLWVSASKWTVAVVLGLLVVFSVGRRFAGWANARLEVTDQRIRIRYRLRKAGWDIPLLSIVEITYVSGPIQRLFGVGVLRVQTSFAPLPAFMLDVADVKQLSQEILVLRNQAWDRHIRSYNQPGSTGELRAAS